MNFANWCDSALAEDANIACYMKRMLTFLTSPITLLRLSIKDQPCVRIWPGPVSYAIDSKAATLLLWTLKRGNLPASSTPGLTAGPITFSSRALALFHLLLKDV